MDIEYTITLDDLVQLNLVLAERATGMSLWIRHLLGICLGPVGILILYFLIFDSRSQKGIVGIIVLLCFGLFSTGGLASSLFFSAWFLRWRLKHRIQRSPRLLGMRTLYGNAAGLSEMTHNGLFGFEEATDKTVFLRDRKLQILEWKSLQKIKETRHHIILIAKSGGGIIIPIVRKPPAELQAFRDYVMSHWESGKTGLPTPSQEGIWPPPPQFENPKI